MLASAVVETLSRLDQSVAVLQRSHDATNVDLHGEEDFTDAEGEMEGAAEGHGDARAEREHVPPPATGPDTALAAEEDYNATQDQSDDDDMDYADA